MSISTKVKMHNINTHLLRGVLKKKTAVLKTDQNP